MKVGRKGDTLVEVALAIGIFSMVAIAVAAVLSGSTSGAQTSLETTLTREEIDTQAEALRYIQTAYNISRSDTKDNKYYTLWKTITSNAIDLSSYDEDDRNTLLNYAPTSCSALYNSNTNPFYKNSFLINPRMLGSFTTDTINSVYIQANATYPTDSLLQPATIYPRLLYGGQVSDQQDRIINGDSSNDLSRAEGIYVIAVRDAKDTSIVDITGDSVQTSAFYDFYIRSCWYGIDANTPSTISTIIRLYDPDILSDGGTIIVNYAGDDYAYFTNGKPSDQLKSNVRKYTLPGPQERIGWNFKWKVTAINGTIAGYHIDQTLNPGDSITLDEPGQTILTLVPEWTHIKYNINYTFKYPYSSTIEARESQVCYQDETCQLKTADLTASGYKFVGWCAGTADANGNCAGTAYAAGQTFPTGSAFPTEAFSGANNTLNLNPIWRENNETLTVRLSFPSNDCDSHVEGQKSDGTPFHAYYGSKVGSDINGQVLASLDADRTSGGTETFTINTLGGRNYYYYVHNYSGCSFSSATVTLSGTESGTQSFTYNPAHVKNGDWYVFAYKDGQIIPGP